MSTSPDYYEVLQVSNKAEPEVIEAAYKRLVEKWQAERRPGDPSAFDRLTKLDAAYSILSDPERRQAYDEQWTPHAEREDLHPRPPRAEKDTAEEPSVSDTPEYDEARRKYRVALLRQYLVSKLETPELQRGLDQPEDDALLTVPIPSALRCPPLKLRPLHPEHQLTNRNLSLAESGDAFLRSICSERCFHSPISGRQYAQENGFWAWLFFGEIAPGIRALCWPYILICSLVAG